MHMTSTTFISGKYVIANNNDDDDADNDGIGDGEYDCSY